MGRLLFLYVDDMVADQTPFGVVRKRAWKIMRREVLQNTAQRMSINPVSKLDRYWQTVEGRTERIHQVVAELAVTNSCIAQQVKADLIGLQFTEIMPVYSLWVNHVERLWQALHDTITRNSAKIYIRICRM